MVEEVVGGVGVLFWVMLCSGFLINVFNLKICLFVVSLFM